MPKQVIAEIMSNKGLASLTKKYVISREGRKPMFSFKGVSKKQGECHTSVQIQPRISCISGEHEFILLW